MSKVMTKWQDHQGRDFTPPRDARECESIIDDVVPAGGMVVMVKGNRWSVHSADAARPTIGGQGRTEDLKDAVRRALEQARRPRQDYAVTAEDNGQPKLD